MSREKSAPVTGLLAPPSAEDHAAIVKAIEDQKRQTRPYEGDLATPMTGVFNQVEYDRRLRLLFEHHEVALFDWERLARLLILTHVPGLRAGPAKRRRGRPSKRLTGPIRGLLDPRLYEFDSPPARAAGRPVLWTLSKQRELVKLADTWQRGEKTAGYKATDRAFVDYWCDEYARRTGKRPREVKSEHANALRSALSRARKNVSKLSKKS